MSIVIKSLYNISLLWLMKYTYGSQLVPFIFKEMRIISLSIDYEYLSYDIMITQFVSCILKRMNFANPSLEIMNFVNHYLEVMNLIVVISIK